MQPTTIIELAMLFGVVILIALISFLLPKKRRKAAWAVAGIILLIGISIYSIRPFIVQHQTEQAIETLEDHFREAYPDETWVINDTDPYQFDSTQYLHVIFNNESEVVYEYRIEDGKVVQVEDWLLQADSIESSGIELHHLEGGQ